MSVYLNTGCHAVLALLSEGYPPLEGRSPTRYSPVCHATNPLRGLRVRLACIRHAARVYSEPGSNSQVNFVVPPKLLRSVGGSNLLTRAACLKRLSDLCPARRPLPFQERPRSGTRQVKDSSFPTTQRRSAGHDECCPLILDGLCLHVLSSFQRTGRRTDRPPLARNPFAGEPYEDTADSSVCQPLTARDAHQISAELSHWPLPSHCHWTARPPGTPRGLELPHSTFSSRLKHARGHAGLPTV
jgi:hypothetical protein